MSGSTPIITNGNSNGNTSDSLESSTVLLPPRLLTSGPEANDRASKSTFEAVPSMSLLPDRLKDRLLFAVPKKGRLHEKCLELLAGGLCIVTTGLPDGRRSSERRIEPRSGTDATCSRCGHQVQPGSPTGCRSRPESPHSIVNRLSHIPYTLLMQVESSSPPPTSPASSPWVP
jgi:hypothetical protein